MKKTMFTLAAVALMFTGCNNIDEPALPQQSSRTVTFSATMPEDAQTRAFYESDDATPYPGLKMVWEADDVLWLDFVYDSQHYAASATASNVNGNKADFTVTIPTQIPEGESFDVYAAYQKGGEGIVDGDFYCNPSYSYSDLSGDKGIRPLLYGAQKSITTVGAFSLKHAGWVMAFRMKNATDSDVTFDVIAYKGTGSARSIYELNNNSHTFNLIDAKPNGDPNSPVLYTEGELSIPAQSTATFYRWVVSDSTIPEGSFYASIGKTTYWYENFPGATVEPGKVYYADLTWDGTALSLTDEPAEPLEDPLTIEPVSSDINVTISNPLKLTIEYSIVEVGDEVLVPTNAEEISIPVKVGQRLQLFGDNAAYAIITSDYVEYTHIKCTNDFYLYGNIMSLIDSENYSTATELTGDFTFYYLFAENNLLRNHPEKALTLPATKLTKRCYGFMFYGCTSLTTAPELPATTLADYCYWGMFQTCVSLTTAPELPATTLKDSCYGAMFMNCTNLITAPLLPAKELVTLCYMSMFNACKNLNSVTCLAESNISDGVLMWMMGVAETGTFYQAKGVEWPSGMSGIPAGWTQEIY